MSGLPRKISAGLLCFLLALVIYRAKTQAFTIDEAYTFNLYIDQPLSEFARHYDACNHVLHTALTKFVRYWLGTSELVLRSVSLVGALLYFVAAARLARLIAGNGWAHVAGFAALSFNPLILDFLVAARGYGLATALLLWAIYFSILWLERSGESVLLWKAGMAGGLAIAANLTLLVPVAALGFVLLGHAWPKRRVFAVFDHFGGPAVVTAFVLVVIPLSKATAANFYVGTPSLSGAAGTLWNGSIRYSPERSPLAYIENYNLPLAALLAAVTVGTAWSLARKAPADQAARALSVVGPVLLVSVATLVGLHHFGGVLYPYGRTGLYLIPLLLLGLLALPWRWGSPVVAVLAMAFALQLDARYFADWKFDAGNDDLARVLAQHGRGTEQKTVAATWLYEQSLKYYRKRHRMHWMNPDIRTRNLDTAAADFYLLTPEDRGLIEKLGLEVLAQDKLSGATLARRRT